MTFFNTVLKNYLEIEPRILYKLKILLPYHPYWPFPTSSVNVNVRAVLRLSRENNAKVKV